MNTVSIFILVALAVIVFLFIFLPFFQHSSKDDPILRRDIQRREILKSTLLTERERSLNALQELDADYDLGKIPEDDYLPIREKLVRDAAEIFQRLDEMNIQTDNSEENVAKLPDGDENNIPVTSIRVQEKIVCVRCGNPVMPGDHYCSVCGLKIMP